MNIRFAAAALCALSIVAVAPSYASLFSNDKPAEVKMDKSTPDSAYVTLQSGNQLMFSYLAMSGTPIDYPEVAGYYSRDYASTSDEFKKHDLLKSLTPRINSEVEKARSVRYVMLNVDVGSNLVKKYDFDKKAFAVLLGVQPGSTRYFGDNSHYKLAFTNGASFAYLHPADENVARQIEATRSRYHGFKADIYAFIQDADVQNNSIKAEIVKIVLHDERTGAVLLTENGTPGATTPTVAKNTTSNSKCGMSRNQVQSMLWSGDKVPKECLH